MENQINVGSQNTQQIGQNPVSQPVISPDKPKVNYLLVAGIVLVCFVVFGLGGYYLGTRSTTLKPESKTANQVSNGIVAKTEPTNIQMTPAPTSDPTVNWEVFSDNKIGFTFKHPSRYQLQKPIQGGEAPAEGSFTFYAGSKADMFFLDVIPFTGSLQEFINKYTSRESANGLMYTNLNVSTVLGEQVKQKDVSISLYQYINHYDQNINPGAQDITSYTVFFVKNSKGFILRPNNTFNNLPEILQIVSTFKTL